MKHPRLLVFNSPGALRICPELAAEIGLNESIMLLQIEFLISLPPAKILEDRRWTFQSIRHLRENYFPWWSAATINRVIRKLEDKDLVVIGNFNKKKYDRTRWFALNEQGIRALSSVRLSQNETRSNQNETHSTQNETTIPETTTDTTTENDTGPVAPVWTKHPAVQAFREQTHYYPKGDWNQVVAETVGDKPESLGLWRDIVHDWIGFGYNPRNAKSMLEAFEAGGIKRSNDAKPEPVRKYRDITDPAVAIARAKEVNG